MALTETKISLKKQFFVFSRYNFHYLRKLFTDLLVDKIKSIVALTILELQLGLSDIFPKSKVCVKTLLVFSYNLQLKLPKALRRVRLSLTNCLQQRRKCSMEIVLEIFTYKQLYFQKQSIRNSHFTISAISPRFGTYQIADLK